ncbi:carboxypeptidase regulatory-like domain-containing protein [Gimesia chilikensis]|uniref:carboxypeptidase-like regulatory domain-containing protein n=1 Tax=Gimesia chilikensis TaxID=2605989 RepID=UPI0011EF888F|nr:carboxypeptidase-like regulatory domain-containing protein [Gimesia chilikensis]KAA0133311.1 carboxypeptidase regulatory-like domain-containing protein [Gimesia chilikensis]
MLKLNRQIAVLLMTVGLLSGCGGHTSEVPDNLVPVTGTVKLDGEPKANITVIFNPGKKTSGTGGYGVTDKDGKYTLTHRSNKPGVEPGEYVVTFSMMGLPDGSPIPEGKDAADVGAVQLLPEKYTNPNREMNLTIATVAAPSATLDYEIKSK